MDGTIRRALDGDDNCHDLAGRRDNSGEFVRECAPKASAHAGARRKPSEIIGVVVTLDPIIPLRTGAAHKLPPLFLKRS
jgi:hypothetical protein